MVLVVKNPPANAKDTRDVGSIPGLGRNPWNRKMATISSILAWKNSMDWWATVFGVAKSQTQLSTNSHTYISNHVIAERKDHCHESVPSVVRK